MSQGKGMLDLEHVPNFEEFGVKIGPSFLECKHPFSTPIQDDGFAKLETSIPDWS